MQVKCEMSDGLRDSEALATVVDSEGCRHCLRVENDYLTVIPGTLFEEAAVYLPVLVVGFDSTGKHLVQFDREAETGARRVWVNSSEIMRAV